MDGSAKFWHFPAMGVIPAWQLYGEETPFPDLLHIESIPDRAAGLEWRIAPHRHLHLHQVFLVLSGQIAMTIDGVAHTVQPPALVNMPQGAVHGFHFSAGTEGFVLSLPLAVFPDLFGAAAELAAASARAFVTAAPPDAAALFSGLSVEHALMRPFRATALRAQAAALLAMVLRAAPGGQASVPADPRLAGFAALVSAHLREPWGVADYAKALGLSSRHLGRLCRAATGQSVQAYIAGQRVREACRLLAYTRLPVQGIAFHLGYEDPSYFSRSFQRGTGTSPRAYRARFEG